MASPATGTLSSLYLLGTRPLVRTALELGTGLPSYWEPEAHGNAGRGRFSLRVGRFSTEDGTRQYLVLSAALDSACLSIAQPMASPSFAGTAFPISLPREVRCTVSPGGTKP